MKWNATLYDEVKAPRLDPSEDMLEKAREKAGALDNMSLVECAAQDMEFVEEFDLVFSNSVLQWVKQQEKVLRRTHRALKPGGRVAFQLTSRDFCPEFVRYTGEAVEMLCLGKFFKGWESPWYQPTEEEYAVAMRFEQNRTERGIEFGLRRPFALAKKEDEK